MSNVCAVYGCSNSNKDKDKGISLHVFPKDPTLRQKWAFAMKRKEFKPSITLKCVLFTFNRRTLKLMRKANSKENMSI